MWTSCQISHTKQNSWSGVIATRDESFTYDLFKIYRLFK